MRSDCKMVLPCFTIRSKPHLCISVHRNRDFTASPPEKGFPLNSVLSWEDNVTRYNIPIIRIHNSCRESLICFLHNHPYTL